MYIHYDDCHPKIANKQINTRVHSVEDNGQFLFSSVFEAMWDDLLMAISHHHLSL